MHRASVGVAILFGTLTILAQSPRTATQEHRGGRLQTERVNGRQAAAREVLVRFQRARESADVAAIRALADAELVQTIGATGLRRFRSKSLDASALVARLAGHAGIVYAEPNYVVQSFAEPNDVLFPQLWGLQNVGQPVNGGSPGLAGADVHATQAWNVSVGSTSHVVAVVDTGIDYTHPDLAPNVWSAPSAFTVTIGGAPITCPAGTYGFNAITLTCDPMDDHNHGTHVSGTIGASGNNGLGVAGVTWVTQLMGIKFLDAAGSGTVADAINAIEFAIQVKQAFAATGGADIRVLSASWGGRGFSQALLDEIVAANGHDMLFVAAAGNDGFSNDALPVYPASYSSPNVVAVAATTNTDARASFSNYGASSVDLGAPGTDILSTITGNTYAFASGTSMATPHVSGAAALVLSHCGLDTSELKDVLLGTVEPIAALATTTTSGGRLDIDSALSACSAPPAMPAGLTALAGDGRVTLEWSAAIRATGYNVKRSPSSGGPYALVASNVKTKKYTDTPLVNGTTYYYVVAAVNPVGESADSNEASATPVAPSDLVVSALTAPSTAGAGAPMVVTDTTTNRGGGGAVASTTRFYLSGNAAVDSGDTLLNRAHAVPALAAGAASVETVSLDIPAGTAAGVFYLIAKADADGVVNESSEANNTSVRFVSIGPDLVVPSLTVPATAAPGDAVLVTDTVKNQGGGAAAPSSTRFYLSTNAAVDSSDVLLPESRSASDLPPGTTSSGSTTLMIPSTLSTGTYYIIAKADGELAVAETHEANNTTARPIRIGGDLAVSSLTVPAKAGAGSTIQITDTTANQGAGAVAASVTRFYLSTNVLLDAADPALPGVRAVPGLAAGAASSGSTTLTLPPALATGTYYIFAKADADDTVIEAQETNNTTFRAVQIGGDLVVSALTVPATGGAGGTIAVNDTTANQGGGAAAGSVTRFYFSLNAAVDAGDTLLAGGRAVPDLAAGATSAGSTSVTIPSDVMPGSYYVIAKADADAAVAETQEYNNATARPIAIGPDLAVSSLSVASPAAAGSTVSVSDAVANRGAGGAGPSMLRFYLSTNFILDSNDVLLDGSRSVPALAPAGSSPGSTSLTIPFGTAAGTYFLIAKADADGSVMESQEANNTFWRVIQVTAAASPEG